LARKVEEDFFVFVRRRNGEAQLVVGESIVSSRGWTDGKNHSLRDIFVVA
jgi:hypothetical protein